MNRTEALHDIVYTPNIEFAPITVIIEYSLHNPHDGLQFVLPTDAYPYVRDHQLCLVPAF